MMKLPDQVPLTFEGKTIGVAYLTHDGSGMVQIDGRLDPQQFIGPLNFFQSQNAEVLGEQKVRLVLWRKFVKWG